MNEMKPHTQEERINGICRVCTLSKNDVKKCFGFGMIGDRACDNRHIPSYKEEMNIVMCKYNKFRCANCNNKGYIIVDIDSITLQQVVVCPICKKGKKENEN